MSEFARDLEQSLSELQAYFDGKLACRLSEYVQPREVRKALGLSPAEMAGRLDMDVSAYLAWEGHWTRIRDEWAYCEPSREESPAELLEKLVSARAGGLC